MTERKMAHINLAARSISESSIPDQRFNYEPLLSGHTQASSQYSFLGKSLGHPLWVSSMTGGAKEAGVINHMLAEACVEFGLGMGLGSCRSLLQSDEYFDDFNLRPVIGNDLPFYANIGIAQIEELLLNNELSRIDDLVGEKLNADGLIIHVNPAQEWLQPEGDVFLIPPIETIERFIDHLGHRYKLIVKEVGQGFGPQSLKKLLEMKIDAIEFAAFGGTNFVNIEIERKRSDHAQYMYPMGNVGHTAEEMLEFVNSQLADCSVCNKSLIISGGVKNFLDGFYLVSKSKLPSTYGMAFRLLEHAMISKKDLFDFISAEVDGFRFASKFLTLRESVK